jgi:hypothetical protein
MGLCGAVIVAAPAVVLLTGNAFALLPVIGCVPMMGAMMLMLGGMGGRGRGDSK